MNSSPNSVICVVCCRSISIYAYGKCDHLICYECSTRMRVLCKQNDCPICRTDLPMVIFAHSHVPFNDLCLEEYECKERYGIHFEDDIIVKAYEKLLEHACPICKKDGQEVLFNTFRELKDHVRTVHERFYCKLCVDNLKIFASERKVYNRVELGLHKRKGDADDKSYRGHPLCEFCDTRFMDKDELYRHTRKEHFFCHFCEEDGLHVFYKDIEKLKMHFRVEHFLCERGKCKNEHYVAFRTDIDGKAHVAQEHAEEFTRAELKQARNLELAFALPPRASQRNSLRNAGAASLDYDDDSHNRRGQQGNRRGRDDNHRERHGSRAEARERSKYQSFLEPVEDVGWFSERPFNTQSQEEFPQLGVASSTSSSRTPVSSTLANKVTHTNNTKKCAQPKSKSMSWGIDVQNIEEFPVLGSSKSSNPAMGNGSLSNFAENPPISRQSVSLHFNHGSQNHPSTYMSIKLSAKHNKSGSDSHLGSKKSDTPSIKKPQSAYSLSPAKKNPFEEEFPALGVAAKPIKRFTFNDSSMTKGISSDVSTGADVLHSHKETMPNGSAMKKKKKKKKKLNSQTGKDDNSVDNKNKVSSLAEVSERLLQSAKEESHQEAEDSIDSEESDHEETTASSDHAMLSSNKSKSLPVSPPHAKVFASDDFPALPSNQKNVPIPPGFYSSQKAPSAPPGFSNAQNLEQGGLTISLSSVARQLTTGSAPRTSSLTFTNSSGETFPLGGQSPLMGSMYAHPPNFKNRNQMLITKIQNLLNNSERFGEFKSLSIAFRKNLITAVEYHDSCTRLLDHDGFMEVLPELLVLLPDISKQQELLSAYNAYWKKLKSNAGALPKKKHGSATKFFVCATCQQVLTGEDFKSHTLVHDANSFSVSSSASAPLAMS